MASRIQIRRGVKDTDWDPIADSVTLAAGEPALATGESRGPLIFFGVGTTVFSGLKAQVASFTPHTGSSSRLLHAAFSILGADVT